MKPVLSSAAVLALAFALAGSPSLSGAQSPGAEPASTAGEASPPAGTSEPQAETPSEESPRETLTRALAAYGGIGRTVDWDEGRELFDKAADAGDPVARLWRARLVHYGLGRYKQDEEAARLVAAETREAVSALAEKGDPDALFLMGFVEDTGILADGEEDKQKAAAYYRRAADAGYPYGVTNLAYLHWYGYGVPKDRKESIRLYERAAKEFDFVMAITQLGNSLTDEYPDDPEAVQRAIKLHNQAADRGSYGAVINLGDLMAQGRGMPKDKAKAFEMYERAALADSPRGMQRVGKALLHGEGAEKNPAAALEWLLKAADKGSTSAMNNLGILYNEGDRLADNPVEEDPAEAIRWFRRAAKEKNGNAMFNLASLIWFGRGAEANQADALYWYTKAAERGIPEAMDKLGQIYFHDAGLKNDERAVHWFERAANEGHAGAMNNLGALYEQGLGVPADLDKAVFWYRKAAAQSEKDINEARREEREDDEKNAILIRDKARENLRSLGA